MRAIYISAIEKWVSLKAFIQAVQLAKENPEREFKHGLTTWWGTKGSEIVKQFIEGINDRINQSIPYQERGKDNEKR